MTSRIASCPRKGRPGLAPLFLTLSLLAVAVAGRAQSCGLQWRWANPWPTGTEGVGVVAGEAGFLAVGYSSVATSPDGVTWSPLRPLPIGAYWRVAWGNGRYLAVAYNAPDPAQLWFSEDGQSWIPTGGGHPPLGRIFFAGGLFFNILGAQVSASADGVRWQAIDLGVAVQNVNGIAFGGGLYVILADDGLICTSSDLLHWTQRHSPDATMLWFLTYGNGAFVVAGDEGRLLRSPDGVVWSDLSRVSAMGLNEVFFAGGLFYVQDSEGRLFESSDGSAWREETPPFSYIASMAERGGTVIASTWIHSPSGANEMEMVRTYDGRSWVRVDFSATRRDLWALVGDGAGSTVVAVGDGGAIIVGTPEGPFQAASSGTAMDLRGVAWGEGRFVAVGAAGTILTSEDGLAWTPRPSGVTADLTSVHQYPGLFLCTGTGGTLLTSPDGIAWTRQDSKTEADLFSSAAGDGRYVVGGAGTTILASDDAVHWTVVFQDSPPGQWLSGLAYGNGVFCAVSGCDFSALVSRDGLAWEKVFGSFCGADVVFWRDTFVALSGVGACLGSEDGRTWLELPNTGGAFRSRLAIVGGRLTGVGRTGAVMWADCGPAVFSISPAHGSTLGGGRVTLTGAELGEAEAVYFGERAASSFAVISDREISAVAPPGDQGVVLVMARTPSGCSGWSFGARFEYILPPSIVSVSPARVSAMGGDQLTIRGSNFYGTEVLIDGYVAASSPYSEDTILATALPHPPGAVDVTLRNADGQEATLPRALTYVDPPVIQIVKVVRQPTFQLKITGANFHPGCVVLVNDVPAPKTRFKNPTRVLASGASVARAFKSPYYSVAVRVVNVDDGVSGPTYWAHYP